MSGLAIKRIEGGYIVTHHNVEHVATAEHVANFIVQFWPDVTAHLRTKLGVVEPAAEPPVSEPDDRILNH